MLRGHLSNDNELGLFQVGFKAYMSLGVLLDGFAFSRSGEVFVNPMTQCSPHENEQRQMGKRFHDPKSLKKRVCASFGTIVGLVIRSHIYYDITMLELSR
jgi:hypothetical protein